MNNFVVRWHSSECFSIVSRVYAVDPNRERFLISTGPFRWVPIEECEPFMDKGEED